MACQAHNQVALPIVCQPKTHGPVTIQFNRPVAPKLSAKTIARTTIVPAVICHRLAIGVVTNAHMATILCLKTAYMCVSQFVLTDT